MLSYDAHFHADYPMLLPSLTAFFWRVSGNMSFIVPFIIAATVFLLIPTLIFLDLRRRSLFVACIMLLWFATDDWYARHALSQYADTMLACFFLTAIISVRYYWETRNTLFLIISGACCGGCLWTKNEGMLLVLLFAAFYFKQLFLSKNILWFLGGIVLPLSCYIIFKVFYAPVNDLINNRDEISISYLTDGSRYTLIWNSIKFHFSDQYSYHKIAAIIWLIISVLRKRWSRDMLLVLSCFAAYLLIYLFTPMDLQWHLNTSFDRLVHQLAPAFIYCFAVQFTRAPKNTGQMQLVY